MLSVCFRSLLMDRWREAACRQSDGSLSALPINVQPAAVYQALLPGGGIAKISHFLTFF